MVKEAHYLIEFRLSGYAKKYLKDLIFEVSRNFRVRGVTARKNVVPHITLFGPFTTKKEKEMVRRVVSVVRKYYLVPFKFQGFGNFKENHVIFLNVKPSAMLKDLRYEIAQSLLSICSAQSHDVNVAFRFHGTIAFKDIESKFNDIWRYLKRREEPDINQYLLRVTILKNSKILYEYDLMQKRLLNRRQSLSKHIWNRTVSILKER